MKLGEKVWCGFLLSVAMWDVVFGLHDLQDGQILWGASYLLLGFLLAVAFVDELEGA